MANVTEMILEKAHSAVVSMDQRGLVTYWNPNAERIFGITREEAVGRPLADLIIPERHREAHRSGLARFLNEGVGPMLERRVELDALRADGSQFPIDLTVTAIREGSEWSFTGFIMDVSWRRERDREREQLVDELRDALRGSERRFEAIVGSLSDAVTIRTPDHELIYANRAALAHLGFRSIEELRTTGPDAIMAAHRVFDEQGRELSMEQVPSVRILRGETMEPEPLVIRDVDRETGAERWSILKAAPMLDEDGRVEATIMVTEDVTAQKRAEQHGAFLARANEVLSSSLDYEETLRNVAQLAVPQISDWCAVDLMDEDGDRQSVAVAHVDPERLALAEQLRRYEPSQLDPERGLGLVFRTGEPILYPEVTDDMLVAGAVDERHLELLRAVGMRSALIVPMQIGPRTLGAMTMVSAESGRALDSTDVDLASQVAARAAVAIENARLYSERTRIAQTLARSLVPEELDQIPGYELASAYIPAGEGSDVSGDFYDAWQVGDAWFVTIGDVTGKGVEAAALTGFVRHTMRAVSEFLSSPAELLAHLDGALKKQRSLAPCTAVCLRLERDRTLLAVGGHPLPLCVTTAGVTTLGEHGPLLGAIEGAAWHDTAVALEPGGTLLIYTDGVTDAVGPDGERWGFVRLRQTLQSCLEVPVAAVVQRVIAGFESFQVGPHADDAAVLALRPLPRPALTSADQVPQQANVVTMSA
jgi:PAS domain S-box-containing protein